MRAFSKGKLFFDSRAAIITTGLEEEKNCNCLQLQLITRCFSSRVPITTVHTNYSFTNALSNSGCYYTVRGAYNITHHRYTYAQNVLSAKSF